MIKRILLIGGMWAVAIGAVAAPTWIYQVGIMPVRDSEFDLGTTTQAWRDGFFDRLCLTADTCISSWSAGSGDITGASTLGTGSNIFDSESAGILRFNSISAGTNITISTSSDPNTLVISSSGSGSTNYDAFTHPIVGESATTSVMNFTGGFNSSASSTALLLNVSKFPNLTSNGFIKTSGGNGALSIDTTTYESGLTAGDGLTRTVNDFDCDTASGTVFGCLSTTDWTTFNNKQPAGSYLTNYDAFTHPAWGGSATTSLLTFQSGFLSYASSTLLGTVTVGTLTATGTITGSNLSGTNTGDVTLAGTPDYITIANQVITRAKLDISDDTNATGGAGLTLTGNDFAVGNGTCITVNANDVAVTSNCTDAATVDSIEGASLLRSDATDNYTSGTLTFNSGTTLSMASGSTFSSSITGTSTWAGGLEFKNFNLTGTATSTANNGIRLIGGTIQFPSDICAGQTNGGALVTDASGNLICEADDGGGGSVTFGSDNQIPITNSGGTDFEYSSTLLFNGTNFSVGTTTFGTLLNIGSALNVSNATSTFYSALVGGKQTLATFSVLGAETPANSEFATFDTRNNHAVLDFDDTVEETAYFTGVMPRFYAGGTVQVEIQFAATSATTNNVVWAVSFERILAGTDDLDSYGFNATSTVTTAVSGTSGVLSKAWMDISNANIDGIKAGDAFRINITRDGGNASDNATGDAEVLTVTIREQ